MRKTAAQSFMPTNAAACRDRKVNPTRGVDDARFELVDKFTESSVQKTPMQGGLPPSAGEPVREMHVSVAHQQLKC
ncbi:hypothetical protein GSI_00705 [Ganoderma sinense ZZ0214-1]|uniref:Uncharacterized protein n=1 Tax=Ganoderma sinense ZZ0214-1 TaxID=1077348 RepID=A0A2G8STH8_9APHY|nr:hypothetical protein GSI_00705 [Ganoderma sinense ZZ0214-1]